MWKKMLCAVMTIALVVTYSVPGFAETEQKEEEKSNPEIVTEKDCSRDNAVLDESTENMTVFENENGSKTAVIYADNVRFTDEDGTMKD